MNEIFNKRQLKTFNALKIFQSGLFRNFVKFLENVK